ncbi:glycoside hydrolase family 108 protein [Mesorhizobium sp. ASY16-5R]|uniref:glycoside hydrolase family 108 protein n=1 Tax=Mesorhizobium sp. ASY16-5R TaxID=3445772 RepID=UPI003FA10A1D
MDRNFQRAFSLVLKHEGGWADNPADPGGPTMKGVTLATFRRYVKPAATKDDLRKITDAQLATVYRRHYWDVVGGAELPDGVDYAVFDFAVNSGPNRAAKYLQGVVCVRQDGKIGPATLTATRAMMHATVINRLCDDRLAFMKRAKDKKGKLLWPTFGKGWEPRVKSVRSVALEMAARPSAPEPSPKPVESVPVPAPPPAPVSPSIIIEQPAVDWFAWLLSRIRR